MPRDRGEMLDRFLKDERVHLSSVSLQEVYTEILRPSVVPGSDPLTRNHFLRGALVAVTMGSMNDLPLAHFLDLVTNCPNLRTTAMQSVVVEETEYVEDRRWICRGLRSLEVSLQLKRHEVLCENSCRAKIARDITQH
ncbi:hypothetical protein BG003_009003 [Podila horticola]|nr:hypothetical protein BG003_009003 [Podila horticola]